MKFLADESCDFRIVKVLRQANHDVAAISEFARRTEDSEVIALATRETRILITEDKDFGQLVFAHAHASSGVILIRYPALFRQRLLREFVTLVERMEMRLRDSFAVVTPGRVRTTRLPPAN